MTINIRNIGVATVAAVTLLAGCEAEDWENPEYVGKKIMDDDLVVQRAAIEKVGELPEEGQRKVLPQLIKVYNKQGANQKEAMMHIVQLRDPAAKDVYLTELSTDETGYARASAEALGEAGVKEAVPKMLEVMQATDKDEVKLGIVQAFGHMPTAEMVPPLVEILKLDVDSNPIQLHDHACEVLGNLALENKAAITDDALQQVTLAVFFGNMAGQSLDRACGLAIQKIGQPAVPELLKIFKGEREDVQKLMLKYDSPKASFPQNTPKLIAAKRLASLRAEEAAEPFVESLESAKTAPDALKDQKAVDWRVKEGQITSEVIRGLGDIGVEKARGLLESIVKGDYINDEWDDITDWSVELQLRQDAGFALNALGDRGSVPTLLDTADEGVINDMEKRFSMLEGQGQESSQTQRYQFNWMTLRSAAMLSDGTDVARFDAIAKKNAEKYPELSKKMGEFAKVARLGEECLGKGDDQAKGDCFASKLADNRPEIREKAAWELGRLPAEVARPLILKNLGTSFLDTREILAFNLYRMPDQSAIDRVEEILESEESKGGADHRLDRYRLRLLRAFLMNNVE